MPPTLIQLARAQLEYKDELGNYFKNSTLNLKLLPSSSEISALPLLCDVRHDPPRPLVPRALVPTLLQYFHGVSHPGGKARLQVVRTRFIWDRMSSDYLSFVRSCPVCQKSKIHRHVHAPLTDCPLSDDRFLSLHLDLLGPLPESEGMIYLLTIMDRYSRWLEARPR